MGQVRITEFWGPVEASLGGSLGRDGREQAKPGQEDAAAPLPHSPCGPLAVRAELFLTHAPALGHA